MRVLRLALLVVPLLVIWTRAAGATSFSMVPNPIDVGNVLVGASAQGMGTFDGPGGHYDFGLDSSGCGDWTLNTASANTNPGSVVFKATFMPTASGLSQCTVHVYDSGSSNERYSFQVKGNGEKPPKIAVSQPGNFGSVRYNNAAPNSSTQKTVTVNNTGDQDLVISSVTIGGTNPNAFAITSGGTSATITAGNQRQWTITFNPLNPAGPKSATLSFASNDPAMATATVTLDGTATTASISITPTPTLDFGQVSLGSSRAKDATVTNPPVSPASNGGPLGVTVGTITGDTNGWFAFTGCPSTPASCTFSPAYAIASGSNQLVGIKCTPAAADALPHTATLTFTNDGDSGVSSIGLSCTAGASNVKAMPATVDFGTHLVTGGGGTSATMQVMVTNTGNQDATLSFSTSSGQTGEFNVTACSLNPCKVTASGGTVMLDLTYTPATEGDVYTSLDINLTPSGNGPSISLAGHGVDKHLGPVVDAIEFPDTYRNPGDMAMPQDLVLTNTGEWPLTLSDITVAGDPTIWSLAEAAAGTMIGPSGTTGPGTTTFHVLFTPTDAGKAPNAVLHILSNDVDKADAMVTLSGNGKLRNVDVAPGNIDVGTTFAGIAAQLSITHPGELFTVVNKDERPFNVRSLIIEGDDAEAFHVVDTSGNDFAASDIAPGATQQFDIIFDPKYPGDYAATLSLYLDQDPVAQKPVPIKGHAIYVEAHGAGGCNTGGDTGGLTVLLVGGVAVLIRRRRR